jgi:polyisoprenoid-binding protein YceI
MSIPLNPPPNRRSFLQRHWKKLVGGVVGLVIVVLAASFIYAKFINDAPDKLDAGDLTDALNVTTPANTDPPAATVATTGGEATPPSLHAAPDSTVAGGATTVPVGADASAVDGVWNVTTASTLRYRVTVSINGFDTEGVGATNQIAGSLTLAATTATAADFTVDMTTFESDESRRDGQFDGRIMNVDEFPTSSFVLTSPIDFGAVPAAGETVTATATGDLTLRGVTNSVTFELTATLDNGKVGVLGNIPVLFADYGIPNPSFGTISTDDKGLLEFILVFERA